MKNAATYDFSGRDYHIESEDISNLSANGVATLYEMVADGSRVIIRDNGKEGGQIRGAFISPDDYKEFLGLIKFLVEMKRLEKENLPVNSDEIWAKVWKAVEEHSDEREIDGNT